MMRLLSFCLEAASAFEICMPISAVVSSWYLVLSTLSIDDIDQSYCQGSLLDIALWLW